MKQVLFVTTYQTLDKQDRPRRHNIAVVAEPQADFRIRGVWPVGRDGLKPDKEDLRHDISDVLSERLIAELEAEARERWEMDR